MTRSGPARIVREVFLTSGALLGALCIVLTVAGAVADVRPLMFRSGSMEPAISTGDLSISRTVPAASVDRGDVVSVVASTGSRVTHRVVDVSGSGEERRLTLKGDANDKADGELYAVSSVEQVLFTVPTAGYVVNAMSGQIGVFVLGLYVAAMLALVFRRPDGSPDDDGPPQGRPSSRGGRRSAKRSGEVERSMARTAIVATALSSLVVSTPASAAPWVNAVNITGPTFSSATIPGPTGGSCTTNNGGLFGADTATIGWTSAGAGLTYQVVVTSGGVTRLTLPVTGTTTTIAYTDLSPAPGRGVVLVATVRAVSASAPAWVSPQSVARNLQTRASGLTGLFSSEVYCIP